MTLRPAHHDCFPRAARVFARACAVVILNFMGGVEAGAATPSASASADPLPGDYRVIQGRVDRGTYTGWRIFHTSCHTCHGVGGSGTDMAPDLTQRIREYTPRGFAAKVLTSYRIVAMPGLGGDDAAAERERVLEEVLKRERSARGQVVMPAWEADNAVPPHVLDLYAYLSARADGELGPGKPRVLPRR
jgi:mono/diheme cytochrome c family protein